jgi:glycosyltransferase involved in cell wall biosynthesis
MKRVNVITHVILVGFLFITALEAFDEQGVTDFKKFEIVIPSYNNAEWAERNLTSVCFQNYPRDKYHVTYVNDASTDETGKVVADFIARNGLEKHVTLINNPIRKRQLENRYRTFHTIPDDTIIAECDGDDFYIDDNVLLELNAIFQNPEVWMMYSIRHKTSHKGKISKAEPFSYDEIMYHSYRDFFNKPTWPPRAYYAWLFKQVKLKDLLYEGKYYPVLTDPAYMIPMLEMAGRHNQCIDKILYIRNRGNPLAAIKTWSEEFRKKVYDYLSSQEPYDLIEKRETIIREKNRVYPIETCICCTSESMVDKMLTLVHEKFEGLDHSTVFLEVSGQHDVAFQVGKDSIFNTTFNLYDPVRSSFKKMFTDYVTKAPCKYMVFLSDRNACITKKIDLRRCTQALDASFAKIFYVGTDFSITSSTLPCVEVKNHVWAHQFKYQEILGKNKFQLDVALWSKEFLLHLVNRLNFTTINELNAVLSNYTLPPDEVGLIFDESALS